MYGVVISLIVCSRALRAPPSYTQWGAFVNAYFCQFCAAARQKATQFGAFRQAYDAARQIRDLHRHRL